MGQSTKHVKCDGAPRTSGYPGEVQDRTDLLGLCDPMTGIFVEPRVGYPSADMPSVLQIQTWSRARSLPGQQAHTNIGTFIRSHGSGSDLEQASPRVLGEALERYCAFQYHEDELIVASADELGNSGLNLQEIARPSLLEESHAKCPLRRASGKEPIRWARGISLTEKKELLIPALMVFNSLLNPLPGENFWFSISTGCACYPELKAAILSAIYEVIERDALAISWLQKLPLPEIEIDSATDELSLYLDLYDKSSTEIEFKFFDATTDIGVPVVYGIRLVRNSVTAHTAVACSAGASPSEALTKAFRDLSSFGTEPICTSGIPDKFEDFTQILHGASFMAHRDRLTAFDFLLNSGNKIRLSKMSSKTSDPSLDALTNRLRQLNLDVYIANLTTVEARHFDMKVIRAIIPQLLPLSFRYVCQYKGTPRLYSVPKAMGYSPLCEPALNSWPQPFA